MTLNVGDPGDWTAGLNFTYGSGTPYTVEARYRKGFASKTTVRNLRYEC
jgi:hypothetical protein